MGKFKLRSFVKQQLAFYNQMKRSKRRWAGKAELLKEDRQHVLYWLAKLRVKKVVEMLERT